MHPSKPGPLTPPLAFPTPPAVSIVMPVFNAAAFLPAAVGSVLLQDTPAAWELLIVDDGSTDNSLELAQATARQHPTRLRVLTHEANGHHGSSAARNLALQHARAPFTAFLDADDLWLPHALRTQLELMAAFPAAGMAYANAERSWDLLAPVGSAAGIKAGNRLPPLLPPGVEPGLLRSPEPLTWFLEDESLAPCTCTVIVRTEVARNAGGFEDLFQSLYDDQVFYAKLALAAPVAVSTECIARYRRHPDSCCVQAWSNQAAQLEARQRFESWLAAYRRRLALQEA